LSNCLKYSLAKFGKDVTIRFPASCETFVIPELIGACTDKVHFPNPRLAFSDYQFETMSEMLKEIY
jgi:hypothetical protein